MGARWNNLAVCSGHHGHDALDHPGDYCHNDGNGPSTDITAYCSRRWVLPRGLERELLQGRADLPQRGLRHDGDRRQREHHHLQGRKRLALGALARNDSERSSRWRP